MRLLVYIIRFKGILNIFSLTCSKSDSLKSSKRKAARSRCVTVRPTEIITATHLGSGIIVLIAKTRMKTGTAQSPGRLGEEMCVEMNTVADAVEMINKLSPTDKLLL